MQRTNGKGVTALDILKNGSSRSHYEGLRNASRLMTYLGAKASRLAIGTTRNEQLHRELKSWSRNIYQCHRGRLQTAFRIFELAKLLTHSSAAYSPTLIQTSQRRLLSLIAGKLRDEGFFPAPPLYQRGSSVQPCLARDSLQTVLVATDNSSALSRKCKSQANKLNWQKQKKPKRCKEGSTTNIFKRPRIKKPSLT